MIDPEPDPGVMIVDDHPVFRRGMRALLQASGFTAISEAASGTEAIALAHRDRPAVVLMDLGLPDGSGIEVTERLVAEIPTIRVVVVTMFDDHETVAAALHAGAIGYVVKDSPPEQIVVAVRAAQMGASLLGSGLRAPGAAPVAPARFPELTRRENEVLKLIGKGLSNAIIAERLALSSKTVANYVSTVLMKIGAEDRLEAAQLARQFVPPR